jgi:hypothetical protein
MEKWIPVQLEKLETQLTGFQLNWISSFQMDSVFNWIEFRERQFPSLNRESGFFNITGFPVLTESTIPVQFLTVSQFKLDPGFNWKFQF